MSLLFDVVSICSVVGIWPRFVEPALLKTTLLTWPLGEKQKHLRGLTIAHISDLHYFDGISAKFLDKIVTRTLEHKPDLILFTGDFICHANLGGDAQLLSDFLGRLTAPLGSYCIFGNHDFTRYVSLNREGVFDVMKRPHPLFATCRALQLLIGKQPLREYQVSEEARDLLPHEKLVALLQKSPFTLLENKTKTLPVGLNITGLGELSTGRCNPHKAFVDYDARYPTVVLTHNPDSFTELLCFPGDWILAGHTHGGQLHIPVRALARKLSRLRYPEYIRGYFERGGKRLYVNRGLGSPKPFRFLSPPELVIIKGVR